MPKEMNKDELLAAYQKISDSFDQFTQLIRETVASNTGEKTSPDSRLSDYINDSDDARSIGNAIQDGQQAVSDVLHRYGMAPVGYFPTTVITRLEDIGRAQAKLKMILDSDIFDSLGKHDPHWDIADQATLYERLYCMRGPLQCLNDNLWDLWAILRREEE